MCPQGFQDDESHSSCVAWPLDSTSQSLSLTSHKHLLGVEHSLRGLEPSQGQPVPQYPSGLITWDCPLKPSAARVLSPHPQETCGTLHTMGTQRALVGERKGKTQA